MSCDFWDSINDRSQGFGFGKMKKERKSELWSNV